MFDRYTFAARRVVFHARAGVTEIGGDQIDSDFLLWGIAREVPELLEEAGAGAVAEAIARDRASDRKVAANADLPLSRCAASALKSADDEARRLGSKEVRLVHVLLGLLAGHESPAAARLSRCGLVAEQVRALAHEPRILALDDRRADG